MGKKKNKGNNLLSLANRTFARKLSNKERRLFEHKPRSLHCLQNNASRCSRGFKLCPDKLQKVLTNSARSIEHQIILLRQQTVDPTENNFIQRREFTQCLLDCLLEHHSVVYQGIMFGSSINGLGFTDSDIDLKLRPLVQILPDEFEPLVYDQETIERVLRNIAFQTTRCSQAFGEFVPSSRCPLAKLTFLNGDKRKPETLEEGWKYDISFSPSSFGSLNSYYVRFLCHLEPKFHLLAITLKYWAKMHGLIFPGLLSSYALTNMLIFFCQNVTPPLLPTIDEMRARYLFINDNRLKRDLTRMEPNRQSNGSLPRVAPAITQIEWQCLIDLEDNSYQRSSNNDPLCLLLMKFFEFYLDFSYSKNIITIRTGRPVSFKDFPMSTQFHKRFSLKAYLNIQDPFDLKHNLTSGMTGKHFMLFMLTIRSSYERLAREINENFWKPKVFAKFQVPPSNKSDSKNIKSDKNKPSVKDWGLGVLFAPLTVEEKMDLI